jgi:hypothetical protein
VRRQIYLTLWTMVALAFGGAALAQQQPGNTSGPAVKKNVEPPTVVEKQFEGRSMTPEEGNPATGMPGVEGKPGTESGNVAPRSPGLRY